MNLPALGSSSVVAGAKLLLAAVSPFQSLFDHPGITHEFCNRQALQILSTDGLNNYAQFLAAHIAHINAGVYWADKGWKNVSHYFEPLTGKGLWQFANAIDDFSGYYQRALSHARSGNYSKAAFFLGAAAHLVQDLCVPHHARAKVFNGHKEFEGWVRQNYARYVVTGNGRYNDTLNSTSVLYGNAAVAADLYDWVNLDQGGTDYHEAAGILLPLAQRSTAGLFQQFCAAVGTVHNLQVITVA